MFAPVFFIYLDVTPRKQNTHHSIMFNSKMQMSAMLTVSPTLLLGTAWNQLEQNGVHCMICQNNYRKYDVRTLH